MIGEPNILQDPDSGRWSWRYIEDGKVEVVYAGGQRVILDPATGETSDGFHTFTELYRYRLLYNAALFNQWQEDLMSADGPGYWVHKSWRHHDGELCFGGGWFIVMADLPTGQISNHYTGDAWDLFKIPVQQKATPWDGHTPDEAADRLQRFLEG